MNAFQILDKENTPISINKLDQEASKFWGVASHPKYYAEPFPEIMHYGNWYDIIGWSIANQGNYTSGWNNVATTMFNSNLEGFVINHKNKEQVEILNNETLYAKLQAIIKFYEPYIALINHWQSLGYTPKQIKD
jgi:hypothetical protein